MAGFTGYLLKNCATFFFKLFYVIYECSLRAHFPHLVRTNDRPILADFVKMFFIFNGQHWIPLSKDVHVYRAATTNMVYGLSSFKESDAKSNLEKHQYTYSTKNILHVKPSKTAKIWLSKFFLMAMSLKIYIIWKKKSIFGNFS